MTTLILSAGGVVLDLRNTQKRIANVQAVLLEQGYGEAEVKRVLRMATCGRQRGEFRWRTATASGRACAGPMAAVTILPM